MLESQGCVQGQRRKRRENRGSACVRPRVSRGFTELPSSAAHHELPAETQNSELFRILSAFTGELGVTSTTLSTTNYYLTKIK